jgi:tRNA (guanine37-N1)-methyltransferase
VRSLSVEVPTRKGEEVRRKLLDTGLLRKELRIERAGAVLHIPVVGPTGLPFPHREREFQEGVPSVRSYRDLVDVPPRLAPLLPKSFDAIGDIIILRLPDPLREFEQPIGEAILRWNPKVRTVAVDEGVSGELRVRRIRVVAGEPKTRTEHVEFGLRYLVDVEHAYFSPRLGSERLRVAKQVLPGEVVVDMFAGVGPYAIFISRTRKAKAVHAIDANPAAAELLRENVRRNRAESVVVHEGAGQDFLPGLAPVDRVIMDLPQTAREFLPATVPHVRPGGVVHYYTIAERTRVKEAGAEAVELARRGGRTAKVIGSRIVRGYSPGKIHLAIDLRITGAVRRAGPGSGRTAPRTPSRRATSGPRRRSARTARRSSAPGARKRSRSTRRG